MASINFKIQPFSTIKWENVGYQNFAGGRPQFGLSMPKDEFMENIENFKVNKFLDIGKSNLEMKSSNLV